MDEPRGETDAPAGPTQGGAGSNAGFERDTGIVNRTVLIEQVLAVLCLFLLGLRLTVHYGVTSGDVLAFLLLPLSLPTLGRYWGAKWALACGMAAMVAGLFLSRSTAVDHVVVGRAQIAAAALLGGILLGVCTVLWARTILPLWLVGLCFGLGSLMSVPRMTFVYSTGSWKFGYATPVTIVVLSIAVATRMKWPQLAALVGLMAVAAGTDSRSLFATYIVTGALLLCAGRYTWGDDLRASFAKAGLLVVVLAAILTLGQTLILRGYLGAETEQRTVLQLNRSGSLLLGGRPELVGFKSLLMEHPLGYGMGVQPNMHDISIAENAMQAIGADPRLGGLDKYMFYSGQFELHSITADLWAPYGILGLVLAGIIAVVALRFLTAAISGSRVNALVLFLSCVTVWDLLGTPLWTAAPTLTLLLGSAPVVARARREQP
ncbi:hypothetical protein JOB34_11575 [Allobranchiibius sp. GilTou38]|nr:hypothetical protein [Allobranchiibius sp. GilTou38]